MGLVWLRSALLVCGVAIALATPAAADWSPVPFAPKIGSRFLITVEDGTTDAVRSTTRTVTYKFDLNYVAREGDGYRITYLLRDAVVTGNAPSVVLARGAVEALRGVIVRAVTDASGKPLRVENEDAVRNSMRGLTERFLLPYRGNPQLTQMLKQAFEELFTATGSEAAEVFLTPLPLLASAQNTTLKPGEERRSKSSLPNPFGGTLASVQVVKLGANPKPADYSVVETETFDEASVKAAIAALTDRLPSAATPSGADLRAKLPQITLSVTKTRTVEVKDGIARTARTVETTRGSAGDQTSERTRNVNVTVTPIP
ncbi:hypothetical protein [Xanthobacter sp. KR7-225]|uniref:hypothetical protein n=1 Tax=Xanthobacter sp. KR7-225 TaxID=3156613 RepID=UPI0032B47CD7